MHLFIILLSTLILQLAIFVQLAFFSGFSPGGAGYVANHEVDPLMKT